MAEVPSRARQHYIDGIEDFFTKIADVARAQDLAASGPNPPLGARDLSHVAVPLHEILRCMRDTIRESTL